MKMDDFMRGVAEDNDRLRAENAALRERVAVLERAIAALCREAENCAPPPDAIELIGAEVATALGKGFSECLIAYLRELDLWRDAALDAAKEQP